MRSLLPCLFALALLVLASLCACSTPKPSTNKPQAEHTAIQEANENLPQGAALLGSRKWRIGDSAQAQVTADGVMVFADDRLLKVDAITGHPHDLGSAPSDAWVSGDGRVLLEYEDGWRAAPGNPSGEVRFHELNIRLVDTQSEQRTIPLPAQPHNLAISNNGRWIAAHFNTLNNKILLFDTSAPTKPRQLAAAQMGAAQLSFSPDGSQIAWLLNDNTEVVFTKTQSPSLQKFAAPHSRVSALAFDPDGTRLYIGTQDGQISRWELTALDAPTLTIKPAQHHSNPFTHNLEMLALSSDGSMLLAIGARSAVTVLNLTPDLNGHQAIHPRGKLQPLYQNTPQGTSLETMSAGFTPNGEHLIQVTNDGVIRVIETQNWTEALNVPGQHSTQISAVALSHDGLRAATIDNAGQAMVWDTTNADLLATLNHPNGLKAVAFHPKDHDQLLSADSRGEVRLWSVSNAAVKALYVAEQDSIEGISIAWSPSGNRIASVDYDGKLRVWDVGGRLLIDQPLHKVYRALDWSPDGTKLALGSDHGVIDIVDPDTGKTLMHHVRQPVDDDDFINNTTAVSWSPDGSMLLTHQGDVVVWDTKAWTKRWAMPLSEHMASAPQWSPDAQHVVFADSSQRIWWLDAATGQQASWLDAAPGQTFSRPLCDDKCQTTLAVGPGPTMVLNNFDTTATLWRGAINTRPPGKDHLPVEPVEVQTKTMPLPNPAPPCAGDAATDSLGDTLPPCAVQRLGTRRFRANDNITGLAWSPDGTKLVGLGGSTSHKAFVWNVADGLPAGTLNAHGLTEAAFTPGGHLITRTARHIQGWHMAWHQTAWRSPDLRNDSTRILALPNHNEAFVTGLDRHQLAIIDAATGQIKEHIHTSADDPKPLLYSADQLFVSQSRPSLGRALVVYNTKTKAWTALPQGPFDEDDRKALRALDVDQLARLPQGKFLARSEHQLWIGDERVMQRTAPKGPNGQPLKAPQDPQPRMWKHFESSPDGKRLVAIDDHGLAFLMDADLKVIRQLGKTKVGAAAFSPDGTKLAAASETTVTLYNSDTGAQTSLARQGPSGPLHSVIPLSKDFLLTRSTGGWQLWRHKEPQRVRDYPSEGYDQDNIIHHGPRSTRFSRVLQNDTGTIIQVHDTAKPNAKPQQEAAFEDLYLHPTAQSHDGQTVAMHSDGEESIVIYDLLKRTLSQEIPLGDYTPSTALTPDGSLLAMIDNHLQIHDRQGQWLKTAHWDFPDYTAHVAWRNNTKLLLQHDKTLTVWAYPSMTQTDELYTPRLTRPMVISRDGRWLAGADYDGNVFLWNLEDNTQVMAVKGHEAAISDIAFLPDDQHFATTSHDGTALIWRIPQSP